MEQATARFWVHKADGQLVAREPQVDTTIGTNIRETDYRALSPQNGKWLSSFTCFVLYDKVCLCDLHVHVSVPSYKLESSGGFPLNMV
jgi:hypothetical protein